MPLISKEEKIQEDGKEKTAFVTTFTNGTFDQLEELRQFFKQPDKLSVIRFAISVLQSHKDQSDKKNPPTSSTL